MKKRSIVFAGTPEFALPSLKHLIKAGYHVCAVYTKPDKPSGRGQKLNQTPVKGFALDHQIPVYQPETLRDQAAQEILAGLGADVMVVAAYGLILPEAVLNIPQLGCVNVHASLLPHWRGAAPIQRSLLAGDEETGISIMQMDAGLDTGDILYQVPCTIQKEDTSMTLHNKLAEIGGEALVEALDRLFNRGLQGVPQDGESATYAHKINKEEGRIDWEEPASLIERKVRAFNPWPVAYTQLPDLLGEQMVRIWQAQVVEQPISSHVAPGTVLYVGKSGIQVATGDQVINITRLQLPGGKILGVSDVLNAHGRYT